MTSSDVTYLICGGCLLIAVIAFFGLIAVPALRSYRSVWERGAAFALSLYVLAMLVGIGLLIGAVAVAEWPRLF
jgi:hypothetical protein